MRRFATTDPDFETEFDAFLAERRGMPADVDEAVAAVLEAVLSEGLEAVLRYTERFDRVRLTEDKLQVTPREIQAGADACPAEVREAIAFAAARIRAYHERQRPADLRFVDKAGVSLGWRWTPLDAVGVYVPGGRAAYPSTVLMNAIPASVAGVGRIAMITPPGKLEPAVLAAASAAGVSEIWRVGGAQGCAALAHGAGPIQPVDKIAGPGNAYVTEAKRQLYGVVGIDALAGPSEIVVVADAANDPAWIAADLLSQAEHDPGAVVIAGADRWAALVDLIAPEHAELAVADPEPLAAAIRHAGAIFLGRYAPEAIGDYVAGSNHVLPTNRAARFSSGLSVLDFVKRTSLIACDAAAFAALAPATVALAEAEGLPAHARSASIRFNRK